MTSIIVIKNIILSCSYYYGYFVFVYLRPYGRAADPKAIRGIFRSKASCKRSQNTPNKSPKWGQHLHFSDNLGPKCRPGPPKWTLKGPRRPQRVQRTAQELPSGDQSGPREPPRVPNGFPMVPLGQLWVPFGLPWGGFGGLWMTFGDPLDTSGRHCGHFWCKAPEPSKTNEFLGNP